MKKAFIAVILSTIVLCKLTNAQTNTFPSTGPAGIGTTTPDASSLLEIKSTAKGFLMSRMTKAQRDAIAAPATGLLIYQTNNTPGFYYFDGSKWTAVTPKAKGWSLTGNAGTDPNTNFIGTTDNKPLVFKIYNTRSGYLSGDIAGNNTSFGFNGFSANTAGVRNTALGAWALSKNTEGLDNTANGYTALSSNTTGDENTASGVFALFENSTGSANTANGYGALSSNTIGYSNTANGHRALYSNTTGYENTANGVSALNNNTTGTYNTAIGYGALSNNTTAIDNTATGSYALYSDTTGNWNTANGISSLYKNTTGFYNTGIGLQALYNNVTGAYNTAIGLLADVNSGGYNYSTAVGVGATITGSNQVRIGSVGSLEYDPVSIGGKVNWSTLSDGRVKKNIKENVPGLAFINKLKPITYNIDNDVINKIVEHPAIKDKDGETIKSSKEAALAGKANAAIAYTGFVAQDVEKAAKSLNYDFSGVDAAKNDKDLYGLRYAEFVVPLVKAVQELSKINDEKDSAIIGLKSEIKNLRSEMNELKAMIVSSQSTLVTRNAGVNIQQSTAISSTSLQQNIPNPFTNTTSIAYALPQKITSAQIVITNKNGKTLKAINVTNNKGNVKVDASTLASGAYQYSLVVDGKQIATKQMVLTK